MRKLINRSKDQDLSKFETKSIKVKYIEMNIFNDYFQDEMKYLIKMF